MPSDEHPPRENPRCTPSSDDLLIEFDSFLLARVPLDHSQTDSSNTCRHDLPGPPPESAEEQGGQSLLDRQRVSSLAQVPQRATLGYPGQKQPLQRRQRKRVCE